jgi:hypothetical protein
MLLLEPRRKLHLRHLKTHSDGHNFPQHQLPYGSNLSPRRHAAVTWLDLLQFSSSYKVTIIRSIGFHLLHMTGTMNALVPQWRSVLMYKRCAIFYVTYETYRWTYSISTFQVPALRPSLASLVSLMPFCKGPMMHMPVHRSPHRGQTSQKFPLISQLTPGPSPIVVLRGHLSSTAVY